MKLCVSQSDDIDVDDAIRSVVSDLLSCLADEAPRGILVYASPNYDHNTIISALTAQWPGCPLAGCTADGEFSSVAGFAEDSVAVGLLVGEDGELSCGAAMVAGLAESPEATIGAAIKVAMGGLGGEPSLCFVFPDPFAVDLERVCELASSATPEGCLVVGGAAADHRIRLGEPSLPLQFGSSGAGGNAVSVMLVSGNIMLSSGAACGWEPVGPTSVATKASDNIVFEIDGKPATDILRMWYPNSSNTVAAPGDRPIAVFAEDGSTSMRPLFAVDEEGGALVFGGSIPEGSSVRTCEVLKGGILSAASKSAGDALASYPGVAPQGAILVNCAARKWTLGTEAAKESMEVGGALGGVPYLGFYSFGEVVPNGDGASHFQSHTCTTLVFGSV